MSAKEILCYVLFIIVIGIMALHFSTKRDFGNALQMTADEVSYVAAELQARRATDCVLTRSETGFVCREMASDKVFHVTMK